MNKKRIFLFLVMAAFAFCCVSQITGDTYQQANTGKSGKLTFVYNGVSGFIEKDSGGQVKGLLVDIMEEFEAYVKKEKGISLTHEFVYVEDRDFAVFMSQVKDGKGGVFGLSNVSIKEERKQDYLFSPPYLDNVSLLVTNRNASTLGKIEEIASTFNGMEAITVKATTYDQRIQKIKNQYFPSLEVKYFPSGIHVMEELRQNKNAFAVLDLNFYLEALQKKYPFKRHPSCDQRDAPFGIIMPKSNDWEPLLKKFFDSGFIGSSKYSRIISDNLGSQALGLLENIGNQ